ncbi:hypothetical protein LTR37_018127 [Vermiconidia calcicola]|uniref:Uncharacterized protein n=1 Tax=Vermiconidia calcicola TaxID=1690605 RepID=A0ACC3MI50_9PEZI|nr:hypothetical protein LTR37_018127 [Vermiconidia calcicola]
MGDNDDDRSDEAPTPHAFMLSPPRADARGKETLPSEEPLPPPPPSPRVSHASLPRPLTSAPSDSTADALPEPPRTPRLRDFDPFEEPRELDKRPGIGLLDSPWSPKALSSQENPIEGFKECLRLSPSWEYPSDPRFRLPSRPVRRDNAQSIDGSNFGSLTSSRKPTPVRTPQLDLKEFEFVRPAPRMQTLSRSSPWPWYSRNKLFGLPGLTAPSSPTDSEEARRSRKLRP